MIRSQGEIINEYEDWLIKVTGVRVYEGAYTDGEYLNEKGMPREGHNYAKPCAKGDFVVLHPNSKIDGGVKSDNGLAVIPAKNVTGTAKIIGELYTVAEEMKDDAYNKTLTEGYRKATVKFFGRVRAYTLAAEHPEIVPYDYLTIIPGTNTFTKANKVTPFMSMVKVAENRGHNVQVLCNPEILTIGE